jgi:O-6-methylguanine DNA methyltransferase
MKEITSREFIIYSIFDTPFGFCGLVSSNRGLLRVILGKRSQKSLIYSIKSEYPYSLYSELIEYQEIIEKYFNGERITFDIPLDIEKATQFQRRVWEITKSIPYGEVRTYKWVSLRMGIENGFRAVGKALASNPIPIIIPCHRVVRKDGKLGGYSQGINLKAELLKLEGSI